VKVTLSIICILIISVSVRGLRSLIDSIDNDNPTPEDIKKGLYLVLGTHAWKPGIPAQVLERKKLSTAIILPEDRDLHRRNVSVEETDYMWLWQMI
jgi:hypothetical protein